MKKEIKDRWITALLSGDYLQGTSFLHRNVKGQEFYCCLGVLSDLAFKDGLVARSLSEDTWYYITQTDPSDMSRSGLVDSIIKWSGLYEKDQGHIKIIDDLIHLNDVGLSFQTIVEYIQNLPDDKE